MKPLNVYACYNINEELRLKSSSGSIFFSIAEKVLKNQGIVYGVTMSDDLYSAEYVAVTCEEKIFKLLGSKYLQARVGNTYRQIKRELEFGREVLFSGTGCQINGLKSFLGQEYENLICVDVICHGVPSPKLWKKYIQYQEYKNNGKVANVNFRCKDNGWKNFGIKQIFKKSEDNKLKEVYISKETDSYMQMFLRDYCLRPSCYECMAKKIKMSDITIADFWGIDKVLPELNDDKGVSLVLIRTEKGQKYFEHICKDLIFEEVSYEEGVDNNPSEYSSVKKPIERDTFFKNMQIMNFDQLEKKYGLPFKRSIKSKLKYIIHNVFKDSH